jgi:hypothetical protein
LPGSCRNAPKSPDGSRRRQLAARKKALYLEYRKAQQDMRELVAVKGSVDHLRGLTDNQRNKEQAR